MAIFVETQHPIGRDVGGRFWAPGGAANSSLEFHVRSILVIPRGPGGREAMRNLAHRHQFSLTAMHDPFAATVRVPRACEWHVRDCAHAAAFVCWLRRGFCLIVRQVLIWISPGFKSTAKC